MAEAATDDLIVVATAANLSCGDVVAMKLVPIVGVEAGFCFGGLSLAGLGLAFVGAGLGFLGLGSLFFFGFLPRGRTPLILFVC